MPFANDASGMPSTGTAIDSPLKYHRAWRRVRGPAVAGYADAIGLSASLRSKGDVDVRSVSGLWGGGGHKNAAGLTLTGDFGAQKAALITALIRAIGT